MISILHEKINNILPIHGVADNGDGSYRIDYVDQPNLEQLELVNAVLDSWPLEKAQLEKLLHKKNLNYLFNEKFIFII